MHDVTNPRWLPRLGTVAVLLAACGCTSLGPNALTRERLAYSLALSESVKAQALLNLVKLRYVDAPVFVDVGQIISSDSMEISGGLEATYRFFGIHGMDSAVLNGGGKYTSHPTITFTPLTGDKFMRAMLAPIPPVHILSLIETGYDARFALETCVMSINGLRNRGTLPERISPADARFVQLLEIIGQVQAAGTLGFRLERTGQKEPNCLALFHQPQADAQAASTVGRVKELLALDPKRDRFLVVTGDTPGGPGELAIQCRSMLQIMAVLASYIAVPPEDIASGRALATPAAETDAPLLRVLSGKKLPADTFCAVHYGDHWFWIDKNDWRSKRTVSFVMFLFTLAGSGTETALPVLTIPAG